MTIKDLLEYLELFPEDTGVAVKRWDREAQDFTYHRIMDIRKTSPKIDGASLILEID